MYGRVFLEGLQKLNSDRFREMRDPRKNLVKLSTLEITLQFVKKITAKNVGVDI